METVLLIVSVLIVAIVLLQSNKATNAGSVLTGGSDDLFQKTKERGLELVITRTTLVLGIIFFVISFILFLK